MIKRLLNRNKSEDTLSELAPPGTLAPSFRLGTETGESLELSDLRGRPVVLVFYPADNSPVCTNQLALYNEARGMFEEYDAQILGISVDDQASHRDFARALNLQFPLLSDDEPAGEVARAFGVYDESKGVCQRALIVLDAEGIIRWTHVSPSGVNPGANGILEALESL